MEKAIIDIIDNKASKQYKQLTSNKIKSYRLMLYAGAQVTLNGYSVREISAEINYSEGGTSKLVHKWIELLQHGDVTANLVYAAVQKLIKNKHYVHRKKSAPAPSTNRMSINGVETQQEGEISKELSTTCESTVPKGKKILGFYISPEDEMRATAAKRAAILFFLTYGRGHQPRLNGEYYEPGTYPAKDEDVNKKWLPLVMAAYYCDCDTETIREAGKKGVIERRVYKHKARRAFYEYNVADLDEFIRNRCHSLKT